MDGASRAVEVVYERVARRARAVRATGGVQRAREGEASGAATVARGPRRLVVVRDRDTGERLFVASSGDGVTALRAAARALAACDAQRWRIVSIEPFPWADEVVKGANDGPSARGRRRA